MNAHQRRILRRYLQRLEAADLAETYGDPEAPPMVVHVARHIERLHRRTLRRRYPYRRFVRRREAYGLRCSAQGCNRKAFFVSPRVSPLCKVHFDDDVPF